MGAAIADWPQPLEVWELAHRHIGRQVRRYVQVGSTNELASRLGGDSAYHGTVFLADVQTAGRGQYGRTWQSPAGSSVLMSVLLMPPPQLLRPSILTAW